MKWFRMLSVELIAMVAFIVLISESDTLPILSLFGIKVVAAIVMLVCAYIAIQWHRQGKMPSWWYKQLSEE